MKIPILMLLTFALVGVALCAESPDAIQKLVQSRAKQIVEMDRRFAEELEELKARYSKSGDTESVNLLAAIADHLRSPAAGAAKESCWIWHSGGELILAANGEASHSAWGRRRGTWSLNPYGSIRLEGPSGVFRISFQDGVGHVFHLGKGGKTTISPKNPVASRAAPLPETAASRLSIESIIEELPETIVPLTAQQLNEKVPRSYYFDYRHQPQPGKRIWRRIDDETWHEIYPDGHTTVFKVLGHARVSGTEGTLVVRWPGEAEKKRTAKDGGLQAFIPDRGSAKMHHWYRNTDRGDTEWNDLAPMKDVR